MSQEIKLELLYFDGCPSWKKALENLQTALDIVGIKSDVNLIHIETQEEAVKHKFTGSPTIRLNGKDIFPTGLTDYALGCRVYPSSEGYIGWPTKDMLLEYFYACISAGGLE